MINFSLKMVVFCLKWYFWGPGAPDLPFVLLNQWFRGGISRCKTGKKRKSLKIKILVEILWFSQKFTEFHKKAEFPFKTDSSVPRCARPSKQQLNQSFRGGFLRVPNPEILKFSGNHRKPLFHGNSVNFPENDKIPGNSTFYASSASQVPYEKHSKT